MGQDTLDIKELICPKVDFSVRKDPQLLSAALVKGLSTDREKFDAIFAWVVNNIQYDSKKFNSGKSFSQTPIKKILKRNKGICTDISRVMDTLCKLAGLESVVIYGYTKEIIFDVDDPMFFDNHAWNGIKLNGFWYVYDATWSTGSDVYEYTKCTEWKRRLLDKMYAKTRNGVWRLVSRKKGYRFCGIKGSKEIARANVTFIRIFPKLFIFLLESLPERLKVTHKRVDNSFYYLSQPEIFAIDHFPNFPDWSLTVSPSSIQEFSSDSAYFYRNWFLYNYQTRTGRTCLTCEDYDNLDPIPQEKRTIQSSEENNPENHFVPAISQFELAKLYFQNALKEEDSLQKMALIDTVLTHLKLSKANFSKSQQKNREETKFHISKNKTKEKLLLKQNKMFHDQFKYYFQLMTKRKIKIASLNYKSKTYHAQSKRSFTKFKFNLKKSIGQRVKQPKRIAELELQFNSIQTQSDSLTQIIVSMQDSLEVMGPKLWRNVLESHQLLSPIRFNFSNDIDYRNLLSLDQFDREIMDLRNQITADALVYQKNLDDNILQLSDQYYSQFIEMHKRIKIRDALDLKAARILNILRNAGVRGDEHLKALGNLKDNRIQLSACWYHKNKFFIDALVMSYKIFYKQNKIILRVIDRSSNAERKRKNRINRYIDKKRRRTNHAIEQNMNNVNKLKKEVYLHKNLFLKLLKNKRIKGV